ncbi:hypothetical protein H0H87_001229 [Tephrocybe sp. NHM501043]|nr:hypothetical protein H0H87_001229 [Tephrocybe sp. NHM501043]
MLTRLTALRTIPRLAVVPARLKSSTVEGSVAQDKGFSKKEAAHENEYIHRHDIELLTKLKAEASAFTCSTSLVVDVSVFSKIEKKMLELDKLKQQQKELEKK